MKKGSVIVIKKSKGTLISCKGGSIWLTAYGFFRDVHLKPGDSYRVLTGKKIAMMAISDCRFEIQ